MKQVVVIHGGDAFASYNEYLRFLKKERVDPARGGKKGWKSNLATTLGKGYEVLAPHMPNAQNAKYREWVIWFEKHIPFMRDGVILVGHSLGGSFLAKYLAERHLPKKIRATLLVAPPYDTDGSRKLVEFNSPKSLKKLEEQGGALYLYMSKDDSIVSFNELAKYQKALPKATARVFKKRGHFLQSSFPELVRDIKAL